MSRPLIVVMSHQPAWTNDLLASASADYEFVQCDRLEELSRIAVEANADGVIADLCDVTAGGHSQEQILEQLRDRLSNVPMAMLTPADCPEKLERRAIYSGIMHLRGDTDVGAVMNWLQQKVPAASDLRASSVDHSLSDHVIDWEPTETVDAADSAMHLLHKAARPEDSTVLSGINRQFETFNPELKHMLSDLAIAADKDVTMLLIGETGSGKTFLSNLIHEVSPRRDQPFITVACGALPGDLIESELFGHVKGSFTSAHADKEGKFIAARSGTILLDEIDVLGLEQQVKLLRVIETGFFEPVGSNTTLESQARLVVASNLPLEPLVEAGKFRPDLYYRLSMLKFEIPPLRRRKCDIKVLAMRFIQSKAKKHGIAIARIEQEFFDGLMGYPWPGNVRELEYAIQRAVIYTRDGVLRAEHLPSHVLKRVAGPTNDPTVQLESRAVETGPQVLTSRVASTEKDAIEEALIRNNYNRTRTAKELGVSRVTLYNKMKRYDLS